MSNQVQKDMSHYSDPVHIVNAYGKVICRSKTLRGLLDYARHTRIVDIRVDELADYKTGTGLLSLTFWDGASCKTKFAEFNALLYWLDSRRSWRGVQITVYPLYRAAYPKHSEPYAYSLGERKLQ